MDGFRSTGPTMFNTCAQLPLSDVLHVAKTKLVSAGVLSRLKIVISSTTFLKDGIVVVVVLVVVDSPVVVAVVVVVLAVVVAAVVALVDFVAPGWME